MLLLPPNLVGLWRRRYWRPDPRAAAAFAGKRPVAVVTGASEGIGRELAGAFARGGYDLLLVARSAGGLAETAAGLTPTGVVIATLPADLATPEGCASVESALAAAGAYCDVLVNCAGVGLGKPFAEQPPEALARLIDLNMRGLTDLTRRFLPGMLVRGRGGILNVASLGGLVPGPGQAAYYASKAYVISLTEALASEAAGQGVRICALLPGPVATKFHGRMFAEHSYYLNLMGVSSAKRVAQAGFNGFHGLDTLIYPGVFDRLNALALRWLPHWLMVPAMAFMLRQRRAD